MQENSYSYKNEIDSIDLGKIFRLLLMQSKLIISIVITVFVISYINFSTSTKQYLVKSLLQYESFNPNIFDPSKTISMATSGSSTDIYNLIALYESRTNYLKVIRDLKLNIKIKDLQDDERIDINIISNEENQSSRHKLIFSFSENSYVLLDENFDQIQTSEYGEQIYFNDLIVSINSAYLKDNRPVEINFRNAESMYNSLKSKMTLGPISSANAFYSKDALINVSYVTDDIDLGKEIINYANNIFLNQRIYDETEKSRKAVTFINENIKFIEEDVAVNKLKLKKFREKNKSINVGLEIEAIIKKIESLDKSLSSLDIEIARAQETYTSNNPIFVNLLNQRKLFERQKDEVLSEIEMMPKEQQEYIDLYTNLEISQGLFKELESRRLGFSILEASTIGDIRVVDEAYVVSLVSPSILYVFLMTFIAFLIACIISTIRGFLFLPISNPAEIFDNNIHLPIIGVITEIENQELISDDVKLNTSVESLIVNISSLQENQFDKNLITITSPTPYNGKSTISRLLAEGFTKIGKKVLLVDNDLKRGKIGRSYNVRSINEKTFYTIDESTINNYKIYDNFYLIPRVKGLNNSFQFLYSYNYKDKIKFFKDYFDYVIFDTGPILSVADSSVLVEQSDFNILVARHGISRMNDLKQAIDNFKQINKKIDGIVYNAYAKPKSYYGYYGIYGDYSYQYYSGKYLDDVYDYEKKD
jgi:tyrosine-protein kinase Etk/Wzc